MHSPRWNGLTPHTMDTQQCEHCGARNDAGRALCANCQTPLTAYSGELRGERYQGRLADQVERLNVRPLSVSLMAAFLVVIAVGWPLRAIVYAFGHRATLNGDGSNYLASAFGAIAPIMVTAVLLPVAASLLWIAWAAFTQHVRGWQLSLVALGAFAVYILIKVGEYRLWTLLWEVTAATLTILWFHRSAKSWFGMT